MASIFLSYAREDAPKAKALAKCLERAGHSVWWDRHIHGGSDFSGEIEAALDRSDVILVMWSEASLRSSWVRDEAAVGRDSGRLVPILLDEGAPPLGFRQFQAIPAIGWSGRGHPPNFDAILGAIAAHSDGRKARAIAAPKPSRAITKRAKIMAGLALLIAILAIGTWLFVAKGPGGGPFREDKVSLAVLPFTDLSPGRDKSFFAEGVAEEILSTLAAEPGIKVLGRTSARQIERNPDPKAVRGSLGITHVLEGSMRTAGDELRVNVRLIDTADGSRLWEEVYRGQLSDVFTVQDQIAAAVVGRLRGTFSRRPVQRLSAKTGVDVYQDYLAARALMRTRSSATLGKALPLAQSVVRAAPNYAAGHAMLAELYFLLSDDVVAYGTMPVATARRQAMPHAMKAIELAPKAAAGHAALGLISPAAESVKPLSRAVELDPSRAESRVWLGNTLTELGRHDEMLDQYREATAIEPLWAMPVNALIQALSASGQYSEALDYARRFERRGGSKAQVFRFLAHIARFRGDLSGAVEFSRSALSIDPTLPYLRRHLAADYFLAGLPSEALAILPRELALTRTLYSGGNFRPSAGIWTAPDGDIAIHGLAARRDWGSLIELYATAPTDKAMLCSGGEWQGAIFALALRKGGRAREAEELMECNEKRLTFESRMRARTTNPQHPQVADLEFRRATLLALKGDANGALGWLSRAIERGWIGRPYSTRLQDYPQFDALRDDPRTTALQRKMNDRVAQERADILKVANSKSRAE